MKYIFLGFVISYNPIYIYYLMSHGALGGMSLRIALGSIFIIILAYLSSIVFLYSRRTYFDRSPLIVPMNYLFVFFILSLLVGLISKNDHIYLILDAYPLLEMFAVYYAITLSPINKEKKELERINKWLGMYLFVMCATSILSYAYLTFIQGVTFGALRAYVGGVTVNRLMDFIIPIFLPAIIYYSYKKKSLWIVALCFFSLILALLTFYRTIYLAVFTGLLYYMVLSKGKLLLSIKSLKLFIVLVLMGFALIYLVEKRLHWEYDNSIATLLNERILSIVRPDETDSSASLRMSSNKEMLSELYKCAAIGYGMGGVFENNDGATVQIQVTSNYYLQMILILGLPAGLLFIWVYFKAFLLSFRLAKNTNNDTTQLFFNGCASILISLATILSFFPYSNYFPLLYIFGWICGMVDIYAIDNKRGILLKNSETSDTCEALCKTT